MLAGMRILAALLLAIPLLCQGPDTARQKEAMQKLAFLVGAWKGEATVTMGPGDPLRLEQTEEVQWKLDGLVLVVEGTGRNRATGKLEFNAFATIAFDDRAGTYRFRAYNSGNYLDTELRVTGQGFEWDLPAGPGKVRHRMTLAGGEWVETGELEMPNTPPRRTVELRVKRVR